MRQERIGEGKGAALVLKGKGLCFLARQGRCGCKACAAPSWNLDLGVPQSLGFPLCK